MFIANNGVIPIFYCIFRPSGDLFRELSPFATIFTEKLHYFFVLLVGPWTYSDFRIKFVVPPFLDSYEGFVRKPFVDKLPISTVLFV